MLIAEIAVGLAVIVVVSAIFLAARSDDREASAKLDMLADELEEARNKNNLMVQALKKIASGELLEREAMQIAQEALARVGRAKRADRGDVTSQPGRFNA